MQEPVAATRYRQSKERPSVDPRTDDRGKFVCPYVARANFDLAVLAAAILPYLA